MRAHRLIGFDTESGCYHPWLKLLEIGSLAAGRIALERHADSTLEHNPFTRKTLIASKELKANLKQVAVQGYAVDDQEGEEGVRCVAAPVRDHTGEVIAGISIAGPSIRVTKERIAGLPGHVVQAADEISVAIGYRVMPNGADKATIRKISAHAARLNSGLR